MSYEYTVTIPVEKSRKFRAMVKELGGAVSRGSKKLTAYEQSLEDVKNGRVQSFSSLDDLFADLND